MKPRHYFLLSILLVSVLSSLAYIAYPLHGDELASIEDRTGVRKGPGFVSGITGATIIQKYIVLEGTVIGHGFIEANGLRVPVIIVRSNGSIYNVVMGDHARSYLEKHGGNITIYYHPMHMVNHVVLVRGYLVSLNNTVIATAIQMECPGCTHHGPGHHGWDGWRRHGCMGCERGHGRGG